MRKVSLVALLLVAVAGSARAQASIDPGMTKDQVIAKLGRPASEHSSGTSTYLYYANGKERTMGMSDMVALENGKVVDAVFRSPARSYTGKSSSPAPVSAEDAVVKGGGKAPMKMPKPAPVAKAAPKAPPATKTPAKAAPSAKAPAKAAPPVARKPEPKKAADPKKIEPSKKFSDSTKIATPAPTKKP